MMIGPNTAQLNCGKRAPFSKGPGAEQRIAERLLLVNQLFTLMNLQQPPQLAISPDFVPLPGGRFLMGDDDGRPDEQPAHEVVVKPFSIGRAPVTNAEYACYQ